MTGQNWEDRASDSLHEEEYRLYHRKAALGKARKDAAVCFFGALVFLIMSDGIFFILDLPYWVPRGELEGLFLILFTIGMFIFLAVTGVKTVRGYMEEARVLIPDEIKRTKTVIAVILILIAVYIIAAFAWKTVENKRIEKENAVLSEEYDRMRSSFGKKVSAWFEKNEPYKGFAYLKEVHVSGNIARSGNRIYPSFVIRLIVGDSFDHVSDRKQYGLLEEEQRIGYKAIKTMLESEEFEEYRKFQQSDMSFIKDAWFSSYPEQAYRIETSENTYKYSSAVSDYFVKNGKDYFVSPDQEKKIRTTPTPKAGGGYGGGTYHYYNNGDDYNAEDYDDPEDFYDDNRDVFDDLDDAADYLEDYWDEHGG